MHHTREKFVLQTAGQQKLAIALTMHSGLCMQFFHADQQYIPSYLTIAMSIEEVYDMVE